MKKKILYFIVGFIYMMNMMLECLSREEHISLINNVARKIGFESLQMKDEGSDAKILTVSRGLIILILAPLWPFFVFKGACIGLYNKMN